MNMKKLLKTAAFAMFAAAGADAFASGTNGDIYEFRPCTYDGTSREAWATAAEPLGSGVTTYFKMRLIQATNNVASTTWYTDFTGYGSEELAKLLFPLEIGIYVSGELRYASLVDTKVNSPSAGFTELVFAYKTEPGDFAMPVVLATKEGKPATTSSTSAEFLFNRTGPTGYWSITNQEGQECNLWQWSPNPPYSMPVTPPDGNRMGMTLKEAGIYVKTIDFDSSWESAADSTDPLWRSVHEGSEITVGATPSLEAIAATSNSVTLYVWSTDDRVVKVKGGTPTDIVFGYESDGYTATPVTTNTLVGTVTIAGGRTSQDFEITGVSTNVNNGRCSLILSQWPNFTYPTGTYARDVDYIEVPVKCVEALPTTLIVEADRSTAYAAVGTGWRTHAAVLDVYLSQPLEEDIDVTITPSIAGQAGLDMADYVKFSKSAANVNTIAALSDTVTITIPAGQQRSTANPKVYVYCLRGDSYTSGGSTIDFAPSIPEAQKASTGLTSDDRFQPTGIEVVANNPEFVSPASGTEIGATAGVGQEIEIELADTYADQQISSGNGYKIEVKYNDSLGWRELSGTYYIGTGGLLRDASGKLPALVFPTSSSSTSTGTFNTQIRVTEPINSNRAVLSLVSTVAAPKTVSVSSDAATYNEGEIATFTVQLSSDNDTGAPLYAFLVAGPATATADMFAPLDRNCIITTDMLADDAALALTAGIPVEKDQGGPGKEVSTSLLFLDGALQKRGGSSYYFTVQFCDQETYSADHVVTGYSSNSQNVRVYNVEPTITRVEMAGYEPLDSGYFDGAYPVGQEQSFQAIVDDDGAYDLDNGFQTRWTINRVGGGAQIPVETIIGNPNATNKVVTFNQEGTYKIKVQVKDKDMLDWAAAYNETYVVVVDQPQLSLVVPDTPNETDTRQAIEVGLGGYFNSSVPMVVMVTVTPPSGTGSNTPVLKFDEAAATIPAGFETLAANAIAADGSTASDHYYLSFRGTETQKLNVTEMDGTILTLSPGYSIKVQVLNDATSSDGVKPWSQYYLANTERFYINYDCAPVCNVTAEPTNRWEVAGGAATAYPIRWTVRSDVNNDYTGLWDNGTDKGIWVHFEGCDNADEGEAWVTSRTSGQSGTFIPNFGNSQGDQTVTLTIEDKDGAYVTYTYLYTVAASKFLTTTSTGPFGGTSTSALVSKYKNQGTDAYGSLGQGHTYVDGATFSSAKNFRLRWNLGKNSTATVYAFGYKVADPLDNGSLDGGYDRAIDKKGAATAGTAITDYYRYPWADVDPAGDTYKDSFFYCWIKHQASSDSSVLESSRLGDGITPETPGSVASAQVGLPTEQAEDGTYPDTEVEAIFAREWLPADNLGDINADGVPDVFAVKIWKNADSKSLIEIVSGGDIVDNDLIDLASSNPDGDKLPGILAQGFVMGGVNGYGKSYAPVGLDLASRLELRGIDQGLNATDMTTSDISFGDDEEFAWLQYVATSNALLITEDDEGNVTTNEAAWLDKDARDLALWTPEPGTARYLRMDPTLEDTDADKFPDGWEYFFWYQAKVWAPSYQWRVAHPDDLDSNGNKLLDPEKNKNHEYPGQPRSGQFNVFERFNEKLIMKGDAITADEVMARFDPCNPVNTADLAANPDFDNDGLSDLEELAIGTNPCHWDTDGDRLCDAWEVMMLLDPLSGQKNNNPDGDFMAYRSVRLDYCWIDPADLAANGLSSPLTAESIPEGLRVAGIDYLDLTAGLDYTIETEMAGETFKSKYVMLRDRKIRAYTFEPKFDSAGERMRYGLKEDIPNPIPDNWIAGYFMVDKVMCETIELKAGQELFPDLQFILIHDQVLNGFGFDPRTGWSYIDGYVSDRWNPDKNNKNVGKLDYTGKSVNTRPYSNYDEYLVMQYRTDYGLCYSAKTDPGRRPGETIWSYLRRKTTFPNVLATESSSDEEDESGEDSSGSSTSTTNSAAQAVAEAVAAAFNQTGSDKSPVTTHGADTDGDGVPDGWELYTYRNPNAAPDIEEETGADSTVDGDFDGDGLVYALEYAGVDCCNVYSGCKSIYSKNSGKASGWYNKFFPVNPGTVRYFYKSTSLETGETSVVAREPLWYEGNADGFDTDFDGINDGQEGTAWYGDFYNHNKVFSKGAEEGSSMKLGFIYGTIADDGKTVCFRGGGMNPCTIDTDQDGLPDGWEMQHAGVPVNAATREVVSPGGEGSISGVELDNATFIADGIYSGFTASSTNMIYIAGGMDATWNGDAIFDANSEGPGRSFDRLLGTLRDTDFDHDGLQNFQEYLTQAVRHFRYDDITTPLMGRQLEEGRYDQYGGLASPHTQSFGKVGDDEGTNSGYPVFDAADPEAFAAAAALAWYGRSFVETVTVTTGVKKVIDILDANTGAATTNYTYYTAERQIATDAATKVKQHVNNAGSLLQTTWDEDGWRKLGYFAPPRKYWDRSIVSGKISNPLYMLPVTDNRMYADNSCAGYATTDPRMSDSDGDGMDDYYEMFHGLNPLLGTSPDTASATTWPGGKAGDLVSAQYWMAQGTGVDVPVTFNAYCNEWIYPGYSGYLGRAGRDTGYPAISAPQAWDHILYPWTAGASMADPDGDGIRNDEERINANAADPVGRHTDPTPLWMTERTTPVSYAAQYYIMPELVRTMPWGVSGGHEYALAGLDGNVEDEYGYFRYMYSFEENEGYDTDGDMVGDATEVVSAVRASSDPLVADDPRRSQALWLDGVNSYAISKDLQYRPIDAADFLKQFTVECWVMPEKTGADQTIVERSVGYGGDNIGTDAMAIRANFRIGIDSQDKIYGMFDNNDSIESGLDAPKSCQKVEGGKIPAGKWSHVAMTFDGKELKLYIDGILMDHALTGLVPATGVTGEIQYPGVTNYFPGQLYASAPSAFFIGARPKKQNEYALQPYYIDSNGEHKESFDNYREFFGGYVDEVRVWDGARSNAQILETMKKSLSFADAAENRDIVFTQWYNNNASRNANDGNPALPPELVLNYTFSTLPGAVEAEDVAKTPGGFARRVLAAASSDYATNPDIDTTGLYENIMDLKGSAGDGSVEGDLLVGWWNDCLVHSTVYDDYHVVPWIKNTVSHLPLIDGTVVDSFIYSDDFGAVYTPASEHGLAKFVFPNTGMPYPQTSFWIDRYLRVSHALARARQLGEVYDIYTGLSKFQIRNNFAGTADLVPMGGAYAKACPEMWNGSASEAWELTGGDDDGDGLPDWWEEYARNNDSYELDPSVAITWDTIINVNGVNFPAGKLYTIDVNRGLQPNGEYYPEFANSLDEDADNIPDWWENLFGVFAYGPDDDPDGDGLSNLAEYTFSFGLAPYGYDNGWPILDPLGQRSGNRYNDEVVQKVTDYYLRAPSNFVNAVEGADYGGAAITNIFEKLYLGAIATDRDFMEDWWENLYSLGFANPRQWDATLDRDEDGWSNWAEARASNWYGSYAADGIDAYTTLDAHIDRHPVPALGVRPTYYGVHDVGGATLIVRTSNGTSQRYDSKFVVPALALGAYHYIGGINPGTPLHGYLTPGYVYPKSVRFQKLVTSSEQNYTWNYDWYLENGYTVAQIPTVYSGDYATYQYYLRRWPYIELEIADWGWGDVAFATGVPDALGKTASIIHSGTGATLGTIDLVTGEWTLDTAKLAENDDDPANLGNSVVRVYYERQPGNEWPKTVWLSDTEELLGGSLIDVRTGTPYNLGSRGYIKEGLNTVEAFFDLNGDGEWTPGEPYGVKKGVNIGWQKTDETVIELKDTSKVVPRIDIASGASDWAAIDGAASGYATASSDAAPSGEGEGSSATRTIRIIRTQINGIDTPERQMGTKTYVMDDRGFVTEGDFLSESAGRFDLDWRYLAKDAQDMNVKPLKNALYRVEETVNIVGGGTSNILIAAFTREFKSSRPAATAASPVQNEQVYSAAPSFKFRSDDETATAFRVQIVDEATNLVYDSGLRLLSGRAAEKVDQFVYRFDAPVYADAPAVTNGAPVFADGKSYKWRVALFNAAFPDEDKASDGFSAALDASDGWTKWQSFAMDVKNTGVNPLLPTGFGTANAVVRYYGKALADMPELVSNIIVEAHGTADFSQKPLSQTRLADFEDTSLIDAIDDISTVNATLRGIRPGTTYLMAYIDANNNGVRDSWESWGYANFVGTERTDIYTPQGVTVVDSLTIAPTAVIYIEDCDVNRNEMSDILESDNFATDSVTTEEDTDGDGLVPSVETEIGTDPGAWDTDGDGMPDGWEYRNSDDILDPLNADAETVLYGDVMAYAEVPAYFVTVKNYGDELDAGTVYALLDVSALPPQVGDAASGMTLLKTYAYGDKIGVGSEFEIPSGDYRVIAVTAGPAVLVHAQVYDRFGYSSRTCVAGAGAVNTKAFTALDKYLVVRYLEAIGFRDSAMADGDTLEAWVNKNGKWADYTLKAANADCDRDGLPDGWELYTMFGPDGAGAGTDLAGVAISPWNYGDARGDSPDGVAGFRVLDEYDRGNAPTDPWQTDTDADGITDALAFQYHVKGARALEDADGDGLDNYAEYLLSEVYNLGVKFDPDNAYSVSDYEPDYFFRIGSLYAGQIFTDFDMVEDTLEDMWGDQYANRYAWDATADADEDGWSNFAEARYNDYSATITAPRISHVSGDAEVKDMPVPTLDLTVRYNGDRKLEGSASGGGSSSSSSGDAETTALAPLVVQTYTKAGLLVPDATFRVTPGETASSTYYIGQWAARKVRGTLAPGYVNASSLKVQFAPVGDSNLYTIYAKGIEGVEDDYYTVTYAKYVELVEKYGRDAIVLQARGFEWRDFEKDSAIMVALDESGETGNICLFGVKVGEIDIVTGAFEIDLAPFGEWILTDGESGGESSGESDVADNTAFSVKQSVIRIAYDSTTPKLQQNKLRVWLGNPAEGYVKEGANTVVAFYDLDSNGAYTPGEPMGVATKVAVGWNRAEAEIELTDTSVIITRGAFVAGTETGSSGGTETGDGNATGYSDRMLVYGTESGDMAAIRIGNLSGGQRQRFRVIREGVNGQTLPAAGRRILVDRELELGRRNFFFEGDVLESGEFDIDWSYLRTEILPSYANPTSVTYKIVLGNAYDSNTTSNNLYEIAVVRRFDYERQIAIPVAPGDENAVVRATHPTFKWKMPNNLDTYTAFRIQILDGSTTVWNSGTRRVPPRNLDKEYVWEAPVFVGDELENDKNYTWRVTMLNSKYSDTSWSETKAFRMSVPADGFTYGKIPVCVKYYGPAASLDGVDVRVEAYANPDFTGMPLSRTVASQTGMQTQGAEHVANATLPGLPAGKYFVRAYIDSNGSKGRSADESWGYVCGREKGGSTPFTPVAVAVTFADGGSEIADIYIEDCDTNGNGLPDSWEMAKYGNLTTGAAHVDATVKGSAVVNNSLAGGIKSKYASGSVAEGMQTMLSSKMATAAMTALSLGVSPDKVSVSGGRISVESEVEEVEVESIGFDADGNIAIKISGTQKALGGTLYENVTSVPATVTCKVYRKTSLEDAWGDPVATQTVKVGGDSVETIVMEDDGNSSAFFYVEIEK